MRSRETHNVLQLPVFFSFFLSWFFQLFPKFEKYRKISGNSEQKTILQTTGQLIQFTVLEIQFRSLKYMTIIRIRKNLSNIPFLSKGDRGQGENSVYVNNPLQTVLKHLKLYILTQIVW